MVIRAVAYLRSSSKAKGKQEMSIPEQRAEVERYAKLRGYKIVAEYIDEGRSGSKEIRKRVAYHRLTADCTSGNFTVVVCYDMARISRSDNYEEIRLKKACYDNRITIDTVREQEFKLWTQEGRMKDFLVSENAKQTALAISGGTIRGRAFFAESGFWIKGTAPYGYRKEYDQQRTTKRNVYAKLAIEPTEAEVVKRIFNTILKEHISFLQLGARLTKEGIPTPKRTDGFTKGRWTVAMLSKLVKDITYCGHTQMRFGRQKREVHQQFDNKIHRNTHPYIITDDVFQAVNDIISTKNAQRRKPQTQKGGVLSGLLVCDRCGYRMVKRVSRSGTIMYCCNSRVVSKGDCPQWGVQEKTFLPKLLGWLRDNLDNELINRLQFKGRYQAENSTEADRIRKEIEEHGKRIKNYMRHLGDDTDDETAAEIKRMLPLLRQDKQNLERQLEFIEQQAQTDDLQKLAEWWQRTKAELIQLTPDMIETVQISKQEITDPEEIELVAGFFRDSDGTDINKNAVTVQLPEQDAPTVYTRARGRYFKEGAEAEYIEGVRAHRAELSAFLMRAGVSCKLTFDVQREAKKKTYYQCTEVQFTASVPINSVDVTTTRPAA